MRMNSMTELLKRRIKTSFFCLMALVAAGTSVPGALAATSMAAPSSKNTKGKIVKNSFANPDFAFPQTVSKNAEAEYRRALSGGGPLTALKAAIQLDVADAMVSEDNYRISAARFDSLANVLPSPYDRLSLLLEARIYQEMWSSKQWVYDNRTLPLTPLPENADEWSTPMFRTVVAGLVGRAMSGSESIASVPLSEISGLLTDYDDAVKAGFSVLDFMTICSENVLAPFSSANAETTLPFGRKNEKTGEDSPQDRLLALLDDAIARHSADSDKFILSFFCSRKLDRLSGEERTAWLKECVSRFSETPYGAQFVADYASSFDDGKKADQNVTRRNMYELLRNYKSKFPEAAGMASVQNIINSLETKRLDAGFENRMLPGRENHVSVSGANIYDFYLLVYSLPGNDADKNYTYAALSSGAKLVKAIPVKMGGSMPDQFTDTVAVPPLAPGYYAFVPSTAANASGILQKNRKAHLAVSLVSDLSVVTATLSQSAAERDMFVVSATNQSPVAGAKVTLYPLKNGQRGVPTVRTTDADGRVSVPDGQYYYLVESGADFLGGRLYRQYGTEDPAEHMRGDIFTDLSVYKPGEKVNFSVIAYRWKDKDKSPATESPLRIILMDANRQNVDTLELRTDRFGRADGSFTLPVSGLLGNWMVLAQQPGSEEWVASGYFEVAEYKSPTFMVTVDSASETYRAGETLVFNGKATTYSGMPVGGGKVEYTVRYQPVWWRMLSAGGRYGGETTTAADGSFRIELPTENIIGTDFAKGAYSLEISVTDAAGETQSAAPLRFSLGNAFRIMPEFKAEVCADTDTLDFKVSVRDLTGHPVCKTIYYQIKSDGKVIDGGEFESPSLRVPASLLASGKYVLRMSLTSDFNDSDEDGTVAQSVVVWRRDDRRPPVTDMLWIPEQHVIAAPGAKKVKIKVGSSYADSYILAQISDTHRLIDTRWIKVSDGFATLEVGAPEGDERVYVSFVAMRDLNKKNVTVTVIPYDQTINLKISAESFRDMMEPGAAESWKFRFSYDGKACPSLPALAVMSNKALDAIAPFQWAFNPYASLYWTPLARLSFLNRYGVSNGGSVSPNTGIRSTGNFKIPAWNTYGYSLYSGNVTYYGRVVNQMYKSAARSAGGVEMEAADEAAPEEVLAAVNTTSLKIRGSHPMAKGEEAEDADGGAAAAPGEPTPLREIECPCAFFMPSLVTDRDGIASVDFTAPDFVGTWQFQILGYTDQMKGAVLTLDAVSSKKVMAQLNAPRFLRTGDRATVSATLFNNTGEMAPVSGRIEIVNALTGATIVSEDFASADVVPSGSRVITTSLTVPSETEALIVRAYASVPGHRDGEQTAVPVLPSSTPVVESLPFYIAPDSGAFEVTLPKYDKNAKVTLTYCDNPVWECVTALPGLLRPESVNILSQADALFGNAVASGLLTRYPALLDGIREMADPRNEADSSLYSPLQKNASLKTVLLNNTPWVNDAQAGTLRMHSLMQYADTTASRAVVEAVMRTLSERQQSDGGWSWCPDMKSSVFITGRVLHILASLADMGYLPEGGDKLAKKACGYMDRQLAEEWNRNDRKYFSVSELLNYLYDKSAFRGIGSVSAFSALDAAAIKKIAGGWREFGIGEKATAAMLLERRSMPKESRMILESLRQFASVSPEKGMWFDNLKSGYSGDNTLLTTARVLEAYAMIEPSNPAIDQLRQWMVISKQTQNWGDCRRSAEAIHALLSSGSDWTASNAAPTVTVGGKQIDTKGIAALTGSFVIDLDASAASGKKLSISRSASGPAWGGVLSQYVAPILDVKEVSVPQLSIAKEVYVVTPGADGSIASAGNMEVGDRVRVTLTVTCDRDIEYVAVTDPRAACLEPVDQLSGYTQSDGVWFYREVRDQATNLFIPFLAKGTHVITYDCNADRAGDYSLGVANAQSQYAPEITAHSAGSLIPVR